MLLPCLHFSTAQSGPTLCDPIDCSTQASLSTTNSWNLLELAHVHRVNDTIQPSHPMSCPSPSAFNLSQHQGLFKWVSSLHQVAKVLEFQLQHQSLKWIFRTDFFQDWLVRSPCSPRDSQESSPTPQFKSINSFPGLCSAFFIVQLLHPYVTTGKTIALTLDLCWQSNVSAF